jgi:hypothetical protein
MLKDVPPDVSSIRAGVPRELSRLVRRSLAKDPTHRVQSALDVRNELEELRREIDSGDSSPTCRPRLSEFAERVARSGERPPLPPLRLRACSCGCHSPRGPSTCSGYRTHGR